MFVGLKLGTEPVDSGYETCGMDCGIFDADLDDLGDLGRALGGVV